MLFFDILDGGMKRLQISYIYNYFDLLISSILSFIYFFSKTGRLLNNLEMYKSLFSSTKKYFYAKSSFTSII